MPSLKTYDIFISHAWDYNDDYYRMVGMLNNAPNFKWRNYSVPEHDPVEGGETKKKKVLEEALMRQIRPVNVVLILAGMYTNHSDWIGFEMDFADLMRKPMVGIRPWGQQRTPKAVSEAVKEMVRWNTSSIVAAIRGRSL